ncbi:hypothetical protein JXO52_07760, partial [bacterium]|nr:hypothetical protein [bacterium]
RTPEEVLSPTEKELEAGAPGHWTLDIEYWILIIVYLPHELMNPSTHEPFFRSLALSSRVLCGPLRSLR